MAAAAPLAAQGALADSAAAAARRDAFLRAQQQVNLGRGAQGRAILDSLLSATPARSEAEADVLFWRATIAESWDAAQRDYLRVMLEHERTPRAAEAMLRLAQGEATRGDREAALRYLDRLETQAPDSPLRADAALWKGRILIDRGARPEGCAVLRSGRPLVAAGALELENQYDFLLRGCAQTVAMDTTRAPGTGAAATPPSSRAPAAPSPAAPTSAPATPPATTPASTPTGSGPVWSVQVAAFPDAATANSFAAEISGRGYEARVDGTSAPYRVRFGRYATRAAADAAMLAYRTKERSDAFVVQVPRE